MLEFCKPLPAAVESVQKIHEVINKTGTNSVEIPNEVYIIYRFSQALKRSSHFFSCTSQGHNALPRPGLEPESSDSEPSALTTGLLDKAVALACPRYS